MKSTVEQMAADQEITHMKFTNKKGIELPNTDWIEEQIMHMYVFYTSIF